MIINVIMINQSFMRFCSGHLPIAHTNESTQRPIFLNMIYSNEKPIIEA